MSQAPLYPRLRDWQGGFEPTYEGSVALKPNWRYCAERMARIARVLTTTLDGDSPVSCIGVAGSYGRMEAAAHSDFDLLIIIHDHEDPASDRVKACKAAIFTALESLQLQLPKDWGIFTTPASQAQLTALTSLGDLNESRVIFGKRIQLILDSQPVFAQASFEQLQKAIIDWYATAFVRAADDSQWTYLMNDLVRYYRSYAAWHQFKLTVEHDDSWFIRNAKLRTSRLVMFAGLLLQLGENTRAGEPDAKALLDILKLTPLERLQRIFARYDDVVGSEFMQHYDACFALLEDDARRERLVALAPRAICDLPPPANADYEPLRAHSARLMTLLTQFTLARRHDFSDRFWQYFMY